MREKENVKMDKKLQRIFYKSYRRKFTCPDCKGHDFLRGPRGGLSTNIKCANIKCGSRFNVFVQGRFIERI